MEISKLVVKDDDSEYQWDITLEQGNEFVLNIIKDLTQKRIPYRSKSYGVYWVQNGKVCSVTLE